VSDLRIKDGHGNFVEVLGDRFGNIGTAASVGAWKHGTIAKDGTASSVIDMEGNYAYLQVEVPTIDAATLKLQGAAEGQTFRDLGQSVTTVSGTGAFNDTWILGGWQFIKIVASAAQTTANVTFRVRGVTY